MCSNSGRGQSRTSAAGGATGGISQLSEYDRVTMSAEREDVIHQARDVNNSIASAERTANSVSRNGTRHRILMNEISDLNQRRQQLLNRLSELDQLLGT